MDEKKKKIPKVGEKIVFKLYGSTIQVLIKQCKKIEGGYWYRGMIRGYDEYRKIGHGIMLEGKVDEYGNYGC